MKKNVKYLGAAAAALLAVAPVVASTTVANADTVVGDDMAAGSTTPANPQYPAITLDGSVNANVNTSVSSLTSVSAVKNALKVSGVNGAFIAGVQSAKVSEQNNGGNAVSSLQEGKTYWVQTTITLAGLEANKTYTINGKEYKSDARGVINGLNNDGKGVFVAYSFVAQNPEAVGNPYFSFNGANIANGSFVNNKFDIPANVSDIKNIWTGTTAKLLARYEAANTSIQPATITTTDAQIKEQLANQGVSVADNGAISAKAQSFNVTLTAVNPVNNSLTATVKLQFNRNTAFQLYPMIRYENNYIQQGGHNFQQVPANKLAFKVNSPEAKAIAANPAKGFTATTTADGTSGLIDMHVLSNKVDASTVGVYPVTVYATNANGYKTTYSFNVTILPVAASNTRTAVVNYKPGYGVNIWNVLSSTSVAFTGNRQASGSTVTIYGEKTVNGTKYYQINKEGTQFIQAQYIDGETTTPSTKPSTSSNEEKVSGVATVVYNGRGGVKLLNGEGKYQSQVVKNRSAWKVFAKKTINGREMYRIGNDNQWIPAQYVNFR
ncbi:SLAP domain-containing protein [Lactobacillus hominis]|uniref:NlpC/P60 family protein n=2 Tax=Lactobacillus hominis TaxID=1203033 RepID=I7IVF8_9LACO|nr:SLAP domain-containing protein [Lactobacillus hominis]KRM84266.1 hypothetical protein FC41_GL001186 [Lactobacillus hominis DSM 23910 = CRBIP 24.179]MCT3348267.1 hypothetical protein [Lactobacillus hominis]CCI81368.1 NlpC/P60 family protein [Lactobacillus hominis DSM 23910 = CRBIP 24.179]